MSDQRQPLPEPPPGRGSQNTLFFIVGGLVVLVGILAFVMFGGNIDPNPSQTQTTAEEPASDTDTDATNTQ